MNIMALIQNLATVATVASKQVEALTAETALNVEYHVQTSTGFQVCGYNITYLKNGNVIARKGNEWYYYSDIEFL